MIESPTFESLMHGVVLFFEAVGVAVIFGGFVLALYRAARQHRATGTGVFETLRATFGRSILLGLEVLIAADLVTAVVLSPRSAPRSLAQSSQRRGRRRRPAGALRVARL